MRLVKAAKASHHAKFYSLSTGPKQTVANFEIVSRSNDLFNKIFTNNVPGVKSSILLKKRPKIKGKEVNKCIRQVKDQ